MSYFAKIEQGIVTDVIAADQSVVDVLEGEWVQTSYNTRGGVHYGQDGQPDGGIALRGNYAGIGYTYDSVNDVFYEPRPLDINGQICSSWTISAPTWLWAAPIPKPTEPLVFPQYYIWDESTQLWVIQ
jgi:hypothetical protein